MKVGFMSSWRTESLLLSTISWFHTIMQNSNDSLFHFIHSNIYLSIRQICLLVGKSVLMDCQTIVFFKLLNFSFSQPATTSYGLSILKSSFCPGFQIHEMLAHPLLYMANTIKLYYFAIELGSMGIPIPVFKYSKNIAVHVYTGIYTITISKRCVIYSWHPITQTFEEKWKKVPVIESFL